MPAQKITAAIAADELGINRTRDGDLRPMVTALGLIPMMNTAEEDRRLVVAKWALRNWSAYQAECNARRSMPSRNRNRRAVPHEDPIQAIQVGVDAAIARMDATRQAARALLSEVTAHLDGNDDADMQRAADALADALAAGVDVTDLVAPLMEEVDAYLDGNDDADMQRAADALREFVPAPSSAPRM
jgi:hypothetical protein